MSPLTGHCRCGHLRYEVAAPLGPVVSCHCSFCRRIHGAAFTTIALVPDGAVTWRSGSGEPALFRTPLGNLRHFCGRCASPTWNRSPALPLAAVVISSLAEDDQPPPWAHVNTESKARWHMIGDALPQFAAWPGPDELALLLRQHPDAWLPEMLLGTAQP
jgi:hypothetical protein